MEEKTIHFVPLITLIRNVTGEEHPEFKWDKVDFMDLNFEPGGESIALCDGEGFYIKNEKVGRLFDSVSNGYYRYEESLYSRLN